MEIKEEKVTQTVKTYTFTEDEYHELIYNQRKICVRQSIRIYWILCRKL